MKRPRPVVAWCMRIVVCGALLAACAKVLGLTPEQRTKSFAHRRHVLVGIPCTQCHVEMASAGDQGPLHMPSDASCTSAGCHTTPHNPAACRSCHSDPSAAQSAADARAHLTFSHSVHMKETSGNCARCHVGVADGDGPLRPPMAACWKCHEHDRAREVRNCQACHVNVREEVVPPASHIVHEENYAASHGRHAAAAADVCATCHQQAFCVACHGVTAPVIPARLASTDPFAPSVHRPGFLARHGEEARGEPAACASCHQPERCVDCHTQAGVSGRASPSPHPAGWVGVSTNAHGQAARLDPVACASCHSGAGEMLCVSCHTVGGVGGSPHPPGWSSGQSMASLPCRLCHTLGGR